MRLVRAMFLVGSLFVASPAPAVQLQPSPQWLLAEYEGTLPCADCGGIRTVLVLYGNESPGTNDGVFVLRETYLGSTATERILRGRWTTLRGNASDADATIYQLTPAPSGAVRYFLRASDAELRALDHSQAEIPSPPPHVLRRTTTATALGAYAAIDTARPEIQAAAIFAIREHARRSGRATALRAVAYAEAQIVAGVNYKLCIDLDADIAAERVLAIVYRDLKGRHSLTEWRDGGCR